MSSVQFYGNKRYDLDLRDYDVVFTTYTLVTLDYDEPLEKDQNPKRKRRTFMNGTQSQDESEDENKNKKKRNKEMRIKEKSFSIQYGTGSLQMKDTKLPIKNLWFLRPYAH